MRQRLLALYPEAWRARYAEEMAALLEETPPGPRATLDLLRGALLAHLRPLPAPPAARARGTIAYVLGCFILFCAVGSGFAKTTENFDLVEHWHPVLGTSHAIMAIAAFAAAGALLLAATPLAAVSLRESLRTRESALLKLVAVPPVAIALFAGSVALLALWLNTHHPRTTDGGWALMGLFLLSGAAASFACWAAPRAILRRLRFPRAALTCSLLSIGLVALCMLALAVACGVFLIAIAVDAPGLGASGNGPAQLIDVTTSIAIEFAGMLTLSGLAAVSVARGLRTLSAL